MELQKMEGFREPTEKEAANVYQCNSSVHSLMRIMNGNFEVAHCKIDHVIRDTWYGKMAAVKIDGKRCNNLIQLSSGLVNDWMRDNTMDCCIIRCHYWMGREYVRTYICSAKDLL